MLHLTAIHPLFKEKSHGTNQVCSEKQSCLLLCSLRGWTAQLCSDTNW